MAKNAEDRYQTLLGLKHDLEACRLQWQETGAIAPVELGQRDIPNYFVISEKLYGRAQEVQRNIPLLAILQAFRDLIGLLLTEPPLLLQMGAYRDSEVSPRHPLSQTLDFIRNSGSRVNTITLEPLNQTDRNDLIADTLYCPESAASPLTQLIIANTKGNPFFSNQLLKSLHLAK